MRKNPRIFAALFLLLGIIFGVFALPVTREGLPLFSFQKLFPVLPFRLGLDLRGGTHLVYVANLAEIPSSETGEAMAGLRDIIERRVNLFGVAEPVVQVEQAGGDQRLIVELAGVTDINEAIRLIGATPFLEFREAGNVTLEEADENTPIDDVFTPTQLTGRFLKKAYVDFDPTTSMASVSLEFDDEGAKLFEEITAKNVGKQVAIFLDGALLSAPVVREPISGGRAQITGDFTLKEVKELVRNLNAGALPVPINLISQQSVEASLGHEDLARSLNAALFGIIATMVFMILWYRLPGLLAVVALLFYGSLVLVLFKLFSITLTAAGIAGFILSVGMAVDANILIFERTKEELRAGKNLLTAVQEGFFRAWPSIRDSNVSSLITATILYWFSQSLVRGFALTLAIGILVSMFTAIIVTRAFLFAALGTNEFWKNKLFWFKSGFRN